MSTQSKGPTTPTGSALLGAQVRRLREAAGMTRPELGAMTGVSAIVLRNLELGLSASPPTWRALLRHSSMRPLQDLAMREGVLANLDHCADPPQPVLTIAETIELYLNSLYARGLHSSSILTMAHALRAVFRPALAEPLPNLFPRLARALADDLPARISLRRKQRLTPITCVLYLVRARAFLAWCVQQRRLPANPLDPTVAGAPPAER